MIYTLGIFPGPYPYGSVLDGPPTGAGKFQVIRVHSHEKQKLEALKTLPIYQVDAFSSKIFGGNPAAVIPLTEWLDDQSLQSIASENNLSETAFFVEQEEHYHLRWFTPKAEVRLCGHATLASSHVLFEHLDYPKEQITFETLSGSLIVSRVGDQYQMNFPADFPQECPQLKGLDKALGCEILETYQGRDDVLAVVANETTLAEIDPNQHAIAQLDARGLVVTAPGDTIDFVSRCFFPLHGIPEDPVTGSAHCLMTPYWAKRLGKTKFEARQISERIGELVCELQKDRVLLNGSARTYMKGNIWCP